jgi:hypothetical protein
LKKKIITEGGVGWIVCPSIHTIPYELPACFKQREQQEPQLQQQQLYQLQMMEQVQVEQHWAEEEGRQRG